MLSLIKKIYIYCIDGVCQVFHVKKVDYPKIRVLIVRLDAIGDFIIWLDAAKELRNLYPSEKFHITLLGNRAWGELAVLFDYWDEVWLLNRKKFTHQPWYRLKNLFKIRNAGFDIVVNTTISREFNYGDAVIRASGAAVRIGVVGDTVNIDIHAKNTSDKYYTQLISVKSKDLWEGDANGLFLHGLGLADFKAAVTIFPQHLIQKTKVPETKYCVIFLGGSLNRRKWPTEYYLELIIKIKAYNPLLIVLCGSIDDKDNADVLVKHIKEGILDLTGETTLLELMGIIQGAKCVVGNETSAIHMAAALRVPSVCIIGGGHFGRFLPYRSKRDKNSDPKIVFYSMPCFYCNWHCKFILKSNQAFPCIENISVDEVYARVQQVIV